MEGLAGELLTEPLQLTESIKTAIKEAEIFKVELTDLYERVEQLAQLLRSTVNLLERKRTDSYDQPARRIIAELYKALDKALSLCRKCKRTGVIKRASNSISFSDVRKVNALLDAAIGDISWLLEGKIGSVEDLPPIASTDPMLAWVWDRIALLYSTSPAEKEDGAERLTTLACENERNRKLIVDEGGVSPLLGLLRNGSSLSGRIAAINALGALAANEQRVRQILSEKVVPVFVHILQDAPMKLQAKVAWVIGKMIFQDSEAQVALATESVIRALLSLVVFQTMGRSLDKLYKGRSLSKTRSSAMLDGNRGQFILESDMSDDGRLADQWDVKSTLSDFYGMPWSTLHPQVNELKPRQIHHFRGFSDSYYGGCSPKEVACKDQQSEDPVIKKELLVHVTYALWKLAENNVKACRKMSDSKGLACLSKLVEKESEELQRNTVMTLMEITAAAERDVELRRFAFKATSPTAKTVVQQLLRVVELKHPDLQVPCIKALGCLARTFPAKEIKVITPLVNCLSCTELTVVAEAATSLQKFVNNDNFLHVEHAKTILDAGALCVLVQLVTSDDKDVQVPVLVLLSHLALHTGNGVLLHEAATLKALKAVARTNVAHIQCVSEVLSKALQHLELYQATPQGAHLLSY